MQTRRCLSFLFSGGEGRAPLPCRAWVTRRLHASAAAPSRYPSPLLQTDLVAAQVLAEVIVFDVDTHLHEELLGSGLFMYSLLARCFFSWKVLTEPMSQNSLCERCGARVDRGMCACKKVLRWVGM